MTPTQYCPCLPKMVYQSSQKTYTEMQRAYLTHYLAKNEEKESQVQFPEQPFLDFFPLNTVRILVTDVRISLNIRVYFDTTQ